MKIAFHFPKLASGGVEKMRIILARELIERGVEVDFVLCSAEGEYLEQVPPKVRIVDLKASRTIKSLLPLVRYIKTTKPDYLISSLGPQNIISILAKKLCSVETKFFVTQHNALALQAKTKNDFQQRLVPHIYRWALPHADGVIAVSHGIAKDIEAVTKFPKSKIHVIYNPAYTEHPSTPANANCDGDEYILSIGRLVEQKGFDNLIDAFNRVCDAHPNLKLLILGSGPLKNTLSKQISELNLAKKVHLLGFQSNPEEYMRKAKLFVLASRHEGFGNVIVEALSVGTPVVSTDCDFGPSEILENGKYGALVPVGDVEKMADAISKALSSEHDTIKLKSRGAEFSPSAIVDKYLSIIQGAEQGR